mmetsp:Transcript_83482/g.270069  ORF Transcript_83482/g.270069 Transcript_83482/m.270069 type:complete len:231 (-) Transcript_83482:393-1085(-)
MAPSKLRKRSLPVCMLVRRSLRICCCASATSAAIPWAARCAACVSPTISAAFVAFELVVDARAVASVWTAEKAFCTCCLAARAEAEFSVSLFVSSSRCTAAALKAAESCVAASLWLSANLARRARMKAPSSSDNRAPCSSCSSSARLSSAQAARSACSCASRYFRASAACASSTSCVRYATFISSSAKSLVWPALVPLPSPLTSPLAAMRMVRSNDDATGRFWMPEACSA